MLMTADRDASTLLLDRIRGEFREMPGLQLTVAQAARLWHLDAVTCAEVLSRLVAERFLKYTKGAYVRAGDW